MKAVGLARRIYAVRDCFRNVIQVAFGVDVKQPGGDAQAIPSLAAMCSMVIGTAIQAQFDFDSAAKTDTHNDYLEEEEVIELTNEIYEAVPLYYRKWVIVYIFFELFVFLTSRMLSILQVGNCRSCTLHDTQHVSPPPHAFDHPTGRMSLVESQ
jgi:hypothetical protein